MRLFSRILQDNNTQPLHNKTKTHTNTQDVCARGIIFVLGYYFFSFFFRYNFFLALVRSFGGERGEGKR